MSRKKFDIDHIDAFTMRNQVAPVRPLRRAQRRGDDLEVDRLVGIGEYEKLLAAIGHRVLHALLAGRDESRGRSGVFKIDQALLGGLMVPTGDHAKSTARAFMDMRE